MTATVGFRIPESRLKFTDEALQELPGKQAELSLLGEPEGRLIIEEAYRLEDAMGGVWISGHIIEGSRPFEDPYLEDLAQGMADAMKKEFSFLGMVLKGDSKAWVRAARGIILKMPIHTSVVQPGNPMMGKHAVQGLRVYTYFKPTGEETVQ